MSKKRRQQKSKRRHSKAAPAPATMAKASTRIAATASIGGSAPRGVALPTSENKVPYATAPELPVPPVSSTSPASPFARPELSRARVPTTSDLAPADPDREEPSVPPMGDLDIAFGSPFFDFEPAPLFFDAVPDPFGSNSAGDPLLRIFSPEAVRRRAKFAKYVQAAVGFSIFLCVLALGKAALVRNADDVATPRRGARAPTAAFSLPAPKPIEPGAAPAGAASAAAASLVPPADVVAEALAPTDRPPAESMAPALAAGPPPSVAAASSAPSEDAVISAVGSSPSRVSTPTAAVWDAPTERERARTLLERGKVTDAIAAGERATNLDRSDGEAWLILGAAYQERGDLRQARRCYKACSHEGVRGPRSECAQMLR